MKKWFLVQLGLLLALVAHTGSSSAAGERTSGVADTAAVKEIGKKTSGGFEVTLVAAPPLSEEEIMMRMGKMGMGGMGIMGMSPEPATHWLGVIIRDQKTEKVIPNLSVTLTAKGPVTRKVELMSMPGSYAQNISLPSGKYDIIIKIDSPEEKKKPVDIRFQMNS